MLTLMHGRRGNTLLVNGTANAQSCVPAWLVRLRLVNGSNARTYELGFDVHFVAVERNCTRPHKHQMHAHHNGAYRSYVFLLEVEGVQPLDHALYVALARGERSLPHLAGRSMRLADWYVKLDGGRPVAVANEWYGWVRFDAAGHLLPHTRPALSNNRTQEAERDNVDTAALPGPDELEALSAHVFGR